MARVDIIIEAQNRAQQAFQQLQADLRQSNVHLERIAENTTKVTRETVKLTRSQQIVKRLRNEYNFLRTEVANTAAVTSRFAGALQRQARAQFEAAASLERLQISLTIISGSTAAATQQYQRLLEAARLPGINLQNSLRASLQLQAIGKSGEEATTIIKEFGNAFALAGGSGQQLGGVVHGIRQIISDGKVLQRELNIITSRIAILTPIMQEAFGGNRAEDVRAFAESIGRGDDTVGVFFETILAGLKELPRAGNTAANAIENLADSYERAQASIGSNFLPIVKEASAALESVFKVVERSPELARSIAIFEALGGTFLTVTAAGVGLAAALPAITAAVASLGAPILIPIAAIAALTAGFVALTVASQDVETQIEKLAATFDELDTALRKNHEAIQSNQQAQVESAQSSLTTQRTAIQGHITLLGEEIASIERSIAANRRRAEQGLLPIASTGEGFGTQLEKANARLEVTRQKLQEVNDALRENEEASVPIQKAAVNIETLTKAVTRLKDELEEETTFEGISQGITGDPTSFRQSAQALADIEVLVRVNADRFKELGEAAASGNQEAATALSKLNQQFEGLRDTQADRHIDNLSAAFDELGQSAGVTSSQLEAVLQATQAFASAFQGTGGLITDDVARATELIADIQTRLNSVRREEQLPETAEVPEASEAQTKRVREQVERVRERGKKELQAQVEVARELFRIRKAIREAENQEEIDAAEEQATALLRLNGRFVSQFIELRGLIADEAIGQAERLRDESLSLLSGEVEERQARYEDDLKSQRQVEQAKRQENQKTYDFDALLTGLRTKNRQEAAQGLIRLEERALDVSSQSQRENLIRETNQFVESYHERGEAFRDLVSLAQVLGTELQQAFDLTEQAKRLEDFQDTVKDVLSDIIGLGLDRFSITDTIGDALRSDVATVRFDAELESFIFDEAVFRDVSDALAGVTLNADSLSDAVQSVESSLRLVRFDEDTETQRERLGEDSAERIRRLEAQRRRLLASRPTGDQRGVERTNQRIQDVTARIAEARRDARTRGERFEEDTETRRTRLIEDALNRQAQATSEQTSIFEDIGQSFEDAMKNALADQLAGFLTKAAFDLGIGTLKTALGGILSGIGGALGGLFGGGGGGDGGAPALTTPTPDTGTSDDRSGQVSLGTEDITAPTEAIAIKGAVTLATTDITVPIEAVAIKGAVSLALTDITAPTEALSVLTSSTPTLTVPLESLQVLTHSTPILTAPLQSLAVLTHSTPTIGEIMAVTIPSNTITPVVTLLTEAIDIPANSITPVVTAVAEAIDIPANSIDPVINPVSSIVIPSNAIDPVINAASAIAIPSLPITPIINPVSAIEIPSNPITPTINTPETIDLSRAAVVLPAVLQALLDGVQGRGDEGGDQEGFVDTETGDEGTDGTGSINVADVIANEGRTDKVFGSATTTQTSITPAELTEAIVEGNQQANQSSGWFDLPRTIAEGVQNVVSAVLMSGVAVGGDGVSFGADSGGLTDAQVEALAASLGKDLDSSFRSDFIPTLLGNQPGTVQPGDADPDEDIARAPAAARFDQAAASISAVADVLALDALENVAQDSTLISLGVKLDSIRLATERIADQPLVDQLIEAGVAFPQTLEDSEQTVFCLTCFLRAG